MNGKLVAKNAMWIIVSKGIQMCLSLVITMMTARYLGPSNYGLLNYAISIVAFLLPISLLGFNAVLVQELIENPKEEDKIMGTSIVLSLFSSLVCMGFLSLFVWTTNRNETETLIVCILYGTTMISQTFELMQYWYQAQLLSKITSIVQLISYTVVSLYKIILLIMGMSVRWFALAYAFDYALIGLSLIIMYRKSGGKLQFSKKIGIRLINKSKYYIISTIMVTFFAQQDRIMIKMMLGNYDTGNYSAAVNCATMSGFIFVAIIDSLRPYIYENKKKSIDAYENSLIKLNSIIIFLCLLQGIFFTFLSKYIIMLLYGDQYIDAIGTLKIFIWYSTFSYLGGIRDIWLLGENKQRFLIWINLSGAILI